MAVDSGIGCGPDADRNGDGRVGGSAPEPMLEDRGGSGFADLDGNGVVMGVELGLLLASGTGCRGSWMSVGIISASIQKSIISRSSVWVWLFLRFATAHAGEIRG